MKAILVTVEITTRIVVPDDFNIDDPRDQDYDLIRTRAYPQLIDNLITDGVGDHLTELEDDEEIPYGESIDDPKPDFIDKQIETGDFNDHYRDHI